MEGPWLAIIISCVFFILAIIIPFIVISYIDREKCLHTFEKVDSSEKQIILVCERCGKVKKVKRR